MTLRELASVIAKKEGNKSQARIGDIREILGILSDLVFKADIPIGISFTLWKNGRRRSRRKKSRGR